MVLTCAGLSGKNQTSLYKLLIPRGWNLQTFWSSYNFFLNLRTPWTLWASPSFLLLTIPWAPSGGQAAHRSFSSGNQLGPRITNYSHRAVFCTTVLTQILLTNNTMFRL